MECYEAHFDALACDTRHGVALELLLRSVPGVEVRDAPSRHLAWRQSDALPDHTANSKCLGLQRVKISHAPAQRTRVTRGLTTPTIAKLNMSVNGAGRCVTGLRQQLALRQGHARSEPILKLNVSAYSAR